VSARDFFGSGRGENEEDRPEGWAVFGSIYGVQTEKTCPYYVMTGNRESVKKPSKLHEICGNAKSVILFYSDFILI
jgi:hypothetical protein